MLASKLLSRFKFVDDFFHSNYVDISLMDYLGEIICLSLDSIIFGIFLKEYLQSKHALLAVQKAPEFQTDKKLNQFLDENGGHYPYIAVRGFVKSLGPAIRSINNPKIYGVIQKHVIKEHVASRSSSGFWTESQRTINEVFNSVPFALVSKTGNLEIEVTGALAAKILDLEVISDKFDPNVSGFMDHIWGFFTGVRKRGLQTIEEILKQGTLINAVGEIQSHGGSITIQPPADGTPFFITTMPLNALVRKIDEKVHFYWWLSTGFGVVGLILCGIMLKKYWNKHLDWVKKEEKRKRLEITRKERRKNVRNVENLPEDKVCVVCQINPKEVILLPCGHVSLCEDCSEQINDFCPICKSCIDSKNPAYIT